jgi:hypothetical protein
MNVRRSGVIRRKIEGKWRILQWSTMAKVVASLLAEIPSSPPVSARISGAGLLANAIEVAVGAVAQVPGYPNRDDSLLQLRVILQWITFYYDTIKPDPMALDGQAAINAIAALEAVLKYRFVPDAVRQELPIDIATIARTASDATSASARRRRPKVSRKSALSLAVARERRKHPLAKASEILNRLCGTDAVEEVKDGRVFYWNNEGALVSVGLDRFENIFSDEKPSTG